jgi:enoyl-CoA hydratase/carnithine racemase
VAQSEKQRSGTGEPAVDLRVANNIAWLTLNRPAALNAINDEIRTGLLSAMEQLERDGDIRVVVIQGNERSRGFCVGADIKEFRRPESLVEFRQHSVQTGYIEAMDQSTKPTIASIHGFCLGGGLEIALACDIRIASADATFALPEVDLGLIPGGGGTQRLPRIVGLGRALDLLLSAQRIDAQEAYRIGLLSRLAATKEALINETERLAALIAAKPPLAAAFVKEAARSTTALDLQAGLRLERDLFTLLRSTEDAAAAFLEKRAPRPTGR